MASDLAAGVGVGVALGVFAGVGAGVGTGVGVLASAAIMYDAPVDDVRILVLPVESMICELGRNVRLAAPAEIAVKSTVATSKVPDTGVYEPRAILTVPEPPEEGASTS